MYSKQIKKITELEGKPLKGRMEQSFLKNIRITMCGWGGGGGDGGAVMERF